MSWPKLFLWCVIGATVLFQLQQIPLNIVLPDPPTGGDMGSHFYPSWVLHNYGVAHYSLRTWHPGNMGGEFLLLHYFPAPFLIAEGLSRLMPLGNAFKVMVLLHLLLLPSAVAWALRCLRFSDIQAALGAAASLVFLSNESYAMWGGNAASTMAGQFAHGHALLFLFLWLGSLARELQTRRWPFWSSLCGTFAVLSHPYVAVILPVHALSFLITSERSDRGRALLHVTASGAISFLLCSWWLLPMLENAPWTVAFALTWNRDGLLETSLPPVWWWIFVAALLVQIVFLLMRKRVESLDRIFWQLLCPALVYCLLFFVFPFFGVVDVRALPQAQLYGLVTAALVVGALPSQIRNAGTTLVSIFFAGGLLYLSASQTRYYPAWIKWNFSGWFPKAGSLPFEQLTSFLRGLGGPTRVAYEHHVHTDQTGTIRAFEMLPYFSERATLEGLYLQASLLSPAAFLLQSEISEAPSCPFSQYPCKSASIQGAEARLRLLGVGQLILISPRLVEEARNQPWLSELAQFDQWVVFQLNPLPPMAEVLQIAPVEISADEDYKKQFYLWLSKYPEMPEHLIRNDSYAESWAQTSARNPVAGSDSTKCNATVTATFNKITLDTTCPGRPHLLKFAYHPLLKATTGEPLFLASPGMIALIPQQAHVEISPQETRGWQIGKLLSMCGVLLLLCPLLQPLVRRLQRT